MARRDPYEVLGVPEGSPPDAIRAVYRQLARTFHPDVNADPGAVEHFREITEAFLELSQPRKRRASDRKRRRRAVGEETRTQLGLRVAGIDLGALVGVTVVVQRRPLFADPPEDPEPRRALPPGRR